MCVKLLPLLKTIMPIVRQQAFVRCAFQPSMRDLEASIEIGIQQFPMGAYNGFLITNTHQVDDNVINIKGLFQNRSNVMNV